MLPGAHDGVVAGLLVASGWANVTPYVWRVAGVNAFVLAGRPLQVFAATSSGLSATALTAGWLLLFLGWLRRGCLGLVTRRRGRRRTPRL